VRLVVVFAVLGGFSALESPVDLVGGWVPPLAHPVLELALCAEAPEKCYEADIGLGRITAPP
jgi:hypothetical protein